MLDSERADLAVCLGMSEDAVQQLSEQLIQLEDRLLQAVYPGTAATAARLARPSLPAKILDEFVKMFKLGMRAWPVKLEKWGPRYGLRIEMLAPRLQQHPEWPAYCAQVLHVATKIEQVVERVTRDGMNPSHATTTAVQLANQPLLAAFERQEQREAQRQAAAASLEYPHASPPRRRPPPAAPPTPDAREGCSALGSGPGPAAAQNTLQAPGPAGPRAKEATVGAASAAAPAIPDAREGSLALGSGPGPAATQGDAAVSVASGVKQAFPPGFYSMQGVWRQLVELAQASNVVVSRA